MGGRRQKKLSKAQKSSTFGCFYGQRWVRKGKKTLTSLTTSFCFFVCFFKVCHLDLQGIKLEMTHRLRLFHIVMIP